MYILISMKYIKKYNYNTGSKTLVHRNKLAIYKKYNYNTGSKTLVHRNKLVIYSRLYYM